MGKRQAAIITGGSRGIGKGMAVELAKLGYDIMISHFDFDEQSKADDRMGQETQKQIKTLGVGCEVLRADVSNGQDRKKLVELAKGKFGRCDMLCNNAGVAPSKRLDILEATEESYERVMNINLKGPYFLTQMVANWMVEQSRS